MNFNFPSFIKTSYYNGIENIDFDNPQNNFITIDKKDYIFKKLSESGNKGGNSFILKIYSNVNIANNDDYSLLDDYKPDAILKILKKPIKRGRGGKNVFEKMHMRVFNEIQALEICKSKQSTNVIEIYKSGECVIDNMNYLYYTMEAADYDLKEYIELKHEELTFEHKVKFCKEILEGIKEIDSHKLYHRDIKPDNIFIVNGKWKIGDLGLVGGTRDLNFTIDKTSEFIGPRGWISPEVMNKYLTENKNFKINFDCEIDHQSDIFQLGKLFWYIFQHNAPIGNINFSDFSKEYERIFWIIRKMLHHHKNKRFKHVSEIIPLFKNVQKQLLFSND
jgi:serine/threonine protein kinase